MYVWIIILFNLVILASWAYLLYLDYTLDPEIEAQWNGNPPAWAAKYKTFMQSVRNTSIINGTMVLLTILTALYKHYTSQRVVISGGRR